MGRVRAVVAAAAAAVAGVCAARGWSELPSTSTLLGWLAAVFAALAVLNLARTAAPVGATIGPAVLATVAAVALLSSRLAEHRWHPHPAWWLLTSAGAAAVTVGAILTMPSAPGRVLALGWVRRVKIGPAEPDRYTAVVALGACHLDFMSLTRTGAFGQELALNVRCLVAGGHVTLLVPAGWRIEVEPTSTAIAVSVDDGSRGTDTDGSATLTIALRAFAGGLRIRRR